VGFFNPVPKGKDRRLDLNLTRIEYWLSKGAQTSDRVKQLVSTFRAEQKAAA
jgi:small subunit ribosomal protein S16